MRGAVVKLTREFTLCVTRPFVEMNTTGITQRRYAYTRIVILRCYCVRVYTTLKHAHATRDAFLRHVFADVRGTRGTRPYDNRAAIDNNKKFAIYSGRGSRRNVTRAARFTAAYPNCRTRPYDYYDRGV